MGMAEWIWAGVCVLSLALAAPFAVHARRRAVPYASLAVAFLSLGYLLLAMLFAADVVVQQWPDPTLRFARGCLAGLGVGAILGALGLLAIHAGRRR
ncbi:MAG TPA: hypothetical protein VF116_18420 [Ktedonobacterales bacterium]